MCSLCFTHFSKLAEKTYDAMHLCNSLIVIHVQVHIHIDLLNLSNISQQQLRLACESYMYWGGQDVSALGLMDTSTVLQIHH